MKHIVTIWGTNFLSKEELAVFFAAGYDKAGNAQPSAFPASIGVPSIEEDFLETHYLGSEEERAAFVQYIRQDYSPHGRLAEQLPATFDEWIRDYNSILLLYGNDSPYAR